MGIKKNKKNKKILRLDWSGAIPRKGERLTCRLLHGI